MPSPVGHSLMGYAIWQVSAARAACPRWLHLGVCLFAVNAADLDFLPGLLVGDPNRYHHGISHSLGLALVFGLVMSLWVSRWNGDRMGKNFLLFFTLYASHIALDYFSVDTTPPYGVPMLWALTREYYIAAVPVFLDIERVSSSNREFIASLFSLHNGWAIAVEVLLLLPLALFVGAGRRRRRVSAAAERA